MKATIQVETVTVCCGNCGQAISGPVSGSSLWDREDAQELLVERPKRGVYCDDCGVVVKRKFLPIAALRRAFSWALPKK